MEVQDHLDGDLDFTLVRLVFRSRNIKNLIKISNLYLGEISEMSEISSHSETFNIITSGYAEGNNKLKRKELISLKTLNTHSLSI